MWDGNSGGGYAFFYFIRLHISWNFYNELLIKHFSLKKKKEQALSSAVAIIKGLDLSYKVRWKFQEKKRKKEKETMCFGHQITDSTRSRRRDTKEVILLIALVSCPERDSKLQGGEGNPKGAWQSLWAEKMELRIRGVRWLESTEQSTGRERAVQRFWRPAEAPPPPAQAFTWVLGKGTHVRKLSKARERTTGKRAGRTISQLHRPGNSWCSGQPEWRNL